MPEDNESFKMYEQLLEEANEHERNISQGIINSSLKSFVPSDEDSEDFITSNDIVKTKKKLEKQNKLTSDDDGVIEEEAHFKRYGKRRIHKYTESEMNEIRNSCKRTIVHDYGTYDIYHISDEERAKNDRLFEISMKLAKLKRTYRRVDQYIEAMRVVFEAWNILEKNNYIHTKDEFFQLVAEGKIVSNRIVMPKLKGMNKYNMDVIINYISNPELDASHLVPKKDEKKDYDKWFREDGDETEEEEMARLLSQKEVEYVVDKMDNPETIEVEYIKPKYIKGYDRRSFGKRKGKKGNKHINRIRNSVAEILNKIQNAAHYKEYGNSFSVTNSLFEPAKKEKSVFDDLPFRGSWTNSTDVRLYELMLQEELLKQPTVDEKHLTYADKQLANFFKVLEDHGVNVLELRKQINGNTDSVDRRKEKAVKKKNKKMEGIIIQRITKLNNDDKFKKIVSKAENEISKYRDGEV